MGRVLESKRPGQGDSGLGKPFRRRGGGITWGVRVKRTAGGVPSKGKWGERKSKLDMTESL